MTLEYLDERSAEELMNRLDIAPSENNLQNKVVKHLRELEAVGKLTFFAVPNGGKRRGREAAQMKNRGLRPGVPDLVVLVPAVTLPKFGQIATYHAAPTTVFLELKTDKGKLSAGQIEFRSKVEKMGFSYFVIRSVKDLAEIF